MFWNKALLRNSIVNRTIEDTAWLAPNWFASQASFKEAKKFDSMPLDLEVAPYDIVDWASQKAVGKEYSRCVGLIALVSFEYLHPINCYMNTYGVSRDRAWAVRSKFDKDFAAAQNILSVTKVEFGEFTRDNLRNSFVVSQERMIEIGEELNSCYLECTNPMRQPRMFLEFYNNLVNLVLFSWLMTRNHQPTSYAAKALRNETKQKGNRLWDSAVSRLKSLTKQ